MLDELKFVKGAVGKKDLLPALTHFKIENNTIRSFNGTLALSSPIALDIDCVPKAIPFVKALERCEESVALALTKAKRLSIKSGSFKAFIECVPDERTPHVEPEGELFDLDGASFMAALKVLAPFVGDDASRPWTNGILLNGQSAYATNNVILAEYWIGSVFPVIANIPRVAIRELLRINKPPIQAQATGNSITFLYEGDRWLRTALLSTKWPDIGEMMDIEATPTEIDASMFEGLEIIAPFADDMGRVYLLEGEMQTTLAEGEGAKFALPSFTHSGIYQIEMLLKLKGIATSADFTKYPAACPFYGDRVRGILIGMKE